MIVAAAANLSSTLFFHEGLLLLPAAELEFDADGTERSTILCEVLCLAFSRLAAKHDLHRSKSGQTVHRKCPVREMVCSQKSQMLTVLETPVTAARLVLEVEEDEAAEEEAAGLGYRLNQSQQNEMSLNTFSGASGRMLIHNSLRVECVRHRQKR